MKFKVLCLLINTIFIYSSVNAQRGARIGYIDTEYILENVSEYQKANALLDQKAQKWKADIETLLSEIELQKEELDKERILLTNELYEERLDDIKFEEEKILDYQRKRFGVNGDLIMQKQQLMKPVQDQIFAAVQEIAELRKLDFVFDKSNDVVMLYSSQRYDISDQIIKIIKRSEKRNQGLTNKERKEIAEADKEEQDTSDPYNDREAKLKAKREEAEKAKQERIDARQKQVEERNKQRQALREAKKRELEERRAAAKARRNKQNAPKKSDTDVNANGKEKTENNTAESQNKNTQKNQPKSTAELIDEKRKQKEADRLERLKKLEERKKEIRENKRKAREERVARAKKRDSIAKANKNK